jgi:hypothetical protein
MSYVAPGVQGTELIATWEKQHGPHCCHDLCAFLKEEVLRNKLGRMLINVHSSKSSNFTLA